MPSFLIDASIPLPTEVAHALVAVGYDVRHVNDVQELGSGAKDEDIIPWCYANNVVWVTADLNARRPRQHRNLIRGLGVSVAWFRSPKRFTVKQWLPFVVHRMEMMERHFSGHSSPHYHEYTARSDREIVL